LLWSCIKSAKGGNGVVIYANVVIKWRIERYQAWHQINPLEVGFFGDERAVVASALAGLEQMLRIQCLSRYLSLPFNSSGRIDDVDRRGMG
jgi:hypothetical protein